MSTNTLFDILRDEQPTQQESSYTDFVLKDNKQKQPNEKEAGQLEFLEMAAEKPEQEQKSGSFANASKNLLKAGITGIYKLGRTMGPTYDMKTLGKPEAEIQKEFTQSLENVIPSEESGPLVKLGERALKQGPTMTAFPGGQTLNTIARVVLGSTLGQLTEEFGGGETAQNLAELTAWIGPDVTKKLLETGKSGEIVKAGKALGMTDKQIAPLINSETKLKWLSKLSTKGEGTQKKLADTRTGLNAAYEGLKTEGSNVLSKEEGANFVKSLQDKLFEMPSTVREVISQDLQDLASNPITENSIINFWQDINANLTDKTKQLSNLKNPIKETLAKINPKLANKFEMTNKLYGRYSDIAKKLKPTIVDKVISGSEALRVLGGVTFGNYPVLVEAVGEAAARKLAQSMLTNPRYQQLSQKMINAMKRNYPQAIKKINDAFIKEVKNDSPEAAKMLQSIDWDKWESEVK